MASKEKTITKEQLDEKKTKQVKQEVNDALAAATDMGQDVPVDNGLNVPTPATTPEAKEMAATAKESLAGVDDTGKPANAFKAHDADIKLPQSEPVFSAPGDSEKDALHSSLLRAARANHPEGFQNRKPPTPIVNAAAQKVADKHAAKRAKEAKAA